MSDGNMEKIDLSEFKKAAVSERNEFEEIEWRGLKIKVKHTLDLAGTIKFVSYVTDSCFDSETGEYLPEIVDFAKRSAIVQFYTNITLPEETSEQYELLYGNDLIDSIKNSHIIDLDQFWLIDDAINDKLYYLTSMDIYRIKNGFESLVDGLSKLEESFGEIFGSIDSDSISKIADAVDDGMLDEAKLVKAIMNEKLVSPSAKDIKTDIIDIT